MMIDVRFSIAQMLITITGRRNSAATVAMPLPEVNDAQNTESRMAAFSGEKDNVDSTEKLNKNFPNARSSPMLIKPAIEIYG